MVHLCQLSAFIPFICGELILPQMNGDERRLRRREGLTLATRNRKHFAMIEGLLLDVAPY